MNNVNLPYYFIRPVISSSEAATVGNISNNRNLGEIKAVDTMLSSDGILSSRCSIDQTVLGMSTAMEPQSRIQNGKWSNRDNSKQSNKLLDSVMMSNDINVIGNDDILPVKTYSEHSIESGSSQWLETDSNDARPPNFYIWNDTSPANIHEKETENFYNPNFRLAHNNDSNKNNRYTPKRNATYNGSDNQLSRIGDSSKNGWSVHRSRTLPMPANYANKSMEDPWHQQQSIPKSFKVSAEDRHLQQMDYRTKDFNRSRNKATDRKPVQDPVNNLWQVKKIREGKPPLYHNFANGSYRNSSENPQQLNHKVNNGKVDFGNEDIGHRSKTYESNSRGNTFNRNFSKDNARRPTSLPLYPPNERDIKIPEFSATFPKSSKSISTSAQSGISALNLSTYNKQTYWPPTASLSNHTNNSDVTNQKSINVNGKTPNSIGWSNFTPEADSINNYLSGVWNKSNDTKTMKRQSLDSGLASNENIHNWMPYGGYDVNSQINAENRKNDNFLSGRQHVTGGDESPMFPNHFNILTVLRQSSLEQYWERLKVIMS